MAGMLPSHSRVLRGGLQHCTPNRVLHHASRLTINATEQQACCPALAWDCAGNSKLGARQESDVAHQPDETERSRIRRRHPLQSMGCAPPALAPWHAVGASDERPQAHVRGPHYAGACKEHCQQAGR